MEQDFFDEDNYYYGIALLPKGKGKGKGKGNPKGKGKGNTPLCEGTWCSGIGLQDDRCGEVVCGICLH